MTMKKYMKPVIEISQVDMESLLMTVSLTENTSTDNKMYSNRRRRHEWDTNW